MGSRKILIVDDEKDLCAMLKVNLEQLSGYEVVTASDGREGLKAARERQPDLILLDIMMPGISGLEVLRRLKGDPKTLSIPVVMLSAVKDEESKQEAGRLYDEDYIEKPVRLDTLRSKIEEVLSRLGKV